MKALNTLLLLFMDNTSLSWNILCWNGQGVNDKTKWNSIGNNVEESGAHVFCLQETKCDDFTLQYIQNFALRCFD